MNSPRHSPSAATRTLSRSLLLAAVGGLGLFAPQANSVATSPAIHSGSPEAGDATVRSETRLRKLHLVRPDLIPYPIAYEVYC